MRLRAVTVQKFKNIVDAQRIEIEDDVTGLVGKNEAGKTTVLKAMHRLNPANGVGRQFDVTTEYPRWRLARDRRQEDLSELRPIVAEFELEEADLTEISDLLPAAPPEGTVCFAARTYANGLVIWLRCDLDKLVRAAANESSVAEEDLPELLEGTSISKIKSRAKELSKEVKEESPLRAKALTAFATAIGSLDYLRGITVIGQEAANALAARLPKFFYFSSYNILPGEANLTELAAKVEDKEELTEAERTVVALLAHAGEEPADFMDADYDSRKAELQAASAELSSRVFEYWKQNPDLEVVFDTDNVAVRNHPNGGQTTHRFLKIEIRDGRHGGVETNFSTRSTGFQWFFSFFAAFSEYQSSEEPIIVLLDEPGTSLHGDAQKDFVRFVFEELGASKQTLYTTHSQFMVDPGRYEKLRAVHDRATRRDPNQGVKIGRIDLSADRETVLPVESALGYSISQHLFLGAGHHLALEGSSDFVYLQRFTEHLELQGKAGLDPRLAMIPVGGADNMPAFVALLGRRLKVSALIDGARTSSKVERVKAAARSNGVAESAIVTCAQASQDLPANADIEDLFEAEDYLRLYNWAFDARIKTDDLPQTKEPILRRIEIARGKFDHALPAHMLTQRREEFFAEVKSDTVARFERLFSLLNSTLS
ncbi:AAA family ATPase [Micromonospora terminaliae]|uniref:AAA family ATPase n=1 Tax=Micromonospora terminaliae TaxID=1914461 RepID=A0AAJ2ZFI9_9ACTN|nr:ATP-binding protein [Micromonospora terminaliae]QGL48818.1 AAA family ATPase [Micromonospora terminaliae]